MPLGLPFSLDRKKKQNGQKTTSMPPTAASETPTEDDVIQKLRLEVQDVMDARYDSRFNMLRWLQSNDFNLSKTTHMLRKHLKWRRERNLDDDASGLQRSEVSLECAPLSIVGPNRIGGDRLIVVDQAGRIDINGVMKSVQPTEYLHQMFRNFEKIYKELREIEDRTGSQAQCYYIFDLAGLSFDPFLLSIVVGPFRVSWQLVANHYREFIDKFIVVNTPSYMNVLWGAVCPFIPEAARDRFVFAGSNWKEELLELCDADCLPVRYGGNMKDELVLRDPKPVPKEIYWRPRAGYPLMNELHAVKIPAGKNRVLTYKIQEKSRILVYSHNENDITFTLSYSSKPETAENEMEVVVPSIPKCGMPAMDCFDYLCEYTGYYYLKLSNDAAWLLGSTYRVLIHDSNGKEIQAENSTEKWIKLGQKPKTK